MNPEAIHIALAWSILALLAGSYFQFRTVRRLQDAYLRQMDRYTTTVERQTELYKAIDILMRERMARHVPEDAGSLPVKVGRTFRLDLPEDGIVIPPGHGVELEISIPLDKLVQSDDDDEVSS